MKKKYLLLLLVTLGVISCGKRTIPINSSSEYKSELSNATSSTMHSSYKENLSFSSNESISDSSISSKVNNSSLVVSNDKVDISEWKNYLFHDGKKSQYNDEWTYWYNTSKNPDGQIRGDEYGIDLNKEKQKLVSPSFNSWEKVEVRIKLRFVPRSSNTYKTQNNVPQLVINCYNDSKSLVNNEEIYLTKSNVPSNDKNYYSINTYIYSDTMTSFEIEYKNSVDAGSKWYTYAINEVSLKGWPYGRM